MEDLERLLWTKGVLVAGLAWAFYHMRRLWRAERECPRAPLFRRMPRLPQEAALFRVMLMLLVSVAVVSKAAWLAVIFCALTVLFCFADVTRCRPILYQSTAMLLAMGVCAPEEALGICRLIPLCIYFWAGVLKWNTNFLDGVYPWIVGPLVQRLPGWAGAVVLKMGKLAPWGEAALGVGMLFPGTRDVCLLASLGMHAFILLCFSSLGHRTHGEIWPWNLSMGLANFILFWNTPGVSAASILWGQGSAPHLLALLLFGLLPVLGLLNKVDPLFSHAHMAGRHAQSGLIVAESLRDRLPSNLQALCQPLSFEGLYTLNFALWYLEELKVPPPQARRAIETIALDFARFSPGQHEIQLTRTWFRGVHTLTVEHQNYTWSDLCKLR